MTKPARRQSTLFRRGWIVVLLFLPVLSGCLIHPNYTRLPQWEVPSIEKQRRLAEYHDPFPDDSIGPKTGVRPSGFGTQRSEARRAAELRTVRGLNPRESLPPTSGGPAKRYAHVVSPD